MGSELRRGWPETEIAVWRDYAEYIARMVEHGTAALRERDAEIARLRAALEEIKAYEQTDGRWHLAEIARRALDGKEADGE